MGEAVGDKLVSVVVQEEEQLGDSLEEQLGTLFFCLNKTRLLELRSKAILGHRIHADDWDHNTAAQPGQRHDLQQWVVRNSTRPTSLRRAEWKLSNGALSANSYVKITFN